MGDDAYEFLGPDLLAPPPPIPPPAPAVPGNPNAPNNADTQKDTNELAPVSGAEKYDSEDLFSLIYEFFIPDFKFNLHLLQRQKAYRENHRKERKMGRRTNRSIRRNQKN
uniref:BZIP domain-containing protein n=1 Tax=Caenorhabditis tropicalis TaxID=1561998 RepID=A0A1I7TKN7_9PELO